MIKNLKISPALILIANFLFYPCMAKEEAPKAVKSADGALKVFELESALISESASDLKKEIAGLKKIDVEKEMYSDAPLALRLYFAKAYIQMGDLRNAADSLYILSVEDGLPADLKTGVKRALVDLWERSGSKVSSAFHMRNFLKDAGGEKPDIPVFLSFLSNDFHGRHEYELLKSIMDSQARAVFEKDYLFAKVAIKFDDLASAQRHLARIPDSHGLSPNKYYALGAISVRQSKIEEAIAHFNSCLKMIGDRDESGIIKDAAILALARILSHEGKWKEAASNYKRIKPESHFYNQALFELSYADYKDDNRRDSLESLDRLLINSPEMDLFLEAMRIRGRQFRPAGGYSDAAMNAYNELLQTMSYERSKLEDTVKSYEGKENYILPIINSLSTPYPVQAIPSAMTLKGLSSYATVRNLASIYSELVRLEDEIRMSELITDHIRKTIFDAAYMPSTEKSLSWLNSKKRKAAGIMNEAATSLLKLGDGLNVGDLKAEREEAANLAELMSEREWKGCDSKRMAISGNISAHVRISREIQGLFDKSRHMNELTMTGWKIMDGGRERMALSIRNDIGTEYAELKRLKEESMIHYLDLRSASYRLDEICAYRTSVHYDELNSRAMLNLQRVFASLDTPFNSLLKRKEYSSVKSLFDTALSVAGTPSQADSFAEKIRYARKAVLEKAKSEIKTAQAHNRINREALENLKDKFASISKPGIRLAFSGLKISYSDYIHSYGWAFVSSKFESQKDNRRKLKDLHIRKEMEMRRIENTSSLLSDEN